ncbi:phage late control D family protein [Stenotrophomonas maltophilia]|uniref:phage late control D family protein n=1 Tax=Stenotrophomonas maltophilia TaxID=40324 RepID=UPI0015DE4516|nr:phage late control D family protein [Stenotrophomonas maltophilia]MBA0289206.1 phage late control D family protein [Stenotrophomonas maltophilia]
MSGNYPIPVWQVVLDGMDITSRLAPRLLDLSLTESRGDEADQVDLRVHDHDGRLALPRRGVTLSLAFGWTDKGMINKGTFVVDEAEHSGPPDIITIRARSADLTRTIRTRRERSWHDTTLGAVLRALAGDHALKVAVDPALDRISLPHLDQANESDVNLLTRLGKRFDAIATIKAGTLIFKPIDGAMTDAGIELPVLRLTRAAGDSHRYSVADRDAVTGVRAYWGDRGAARRKAVLVGTDDNEKKLQATYANDAEATQHARAELQRLQRGAATLSMRLALGRADVYPGVKLSISGFKPEIDGTDWLVVKATHSIAGSSGFTTSLELERTQ